MKPVEKWTEEQVLRHKSRKQIYAIIKRSPGLTFSEIMVKSNLPKTTFYHHMSMLLRRGIIKEVKVAQYKKYYTRSFSNNKIVRLPPIQVKIMLVMDENKYTIQRDIVKKSGIPQPTVSRHLKILQSESWIIKRFLKESGLFGYRPVRR